MTGTVDDPLLENGVVSRARHRSPAMKRIFARSRCRGRPFRRLSVPDAAQPSFAFAEVIIQGNVRRRCGIPCYDPRHIQMSSMFSTAWRVSAEALPLLADLRG
jgi:hypothetical protein